MVKKKKQLVSQLGGVDHTDGCKKQGRGLVFSWEMIETNGQNSNNFSLSAGA